jgi:hypothetical protein
MIGGVMGAAGNSRQPIVSALENPLFRDDSDVYGHSAKF